MPGIRDTHEAGSVQGCLIRYAVVAYQQLGQPRYLKMCQQYLLVGGRSVSSDTVLQGAKSNERLWRYDMNTGLYGWCSTNREGSDSAVDLVEELRKQLGV